MCDLILKLISDAIAKKKYPSVKNKNISKQSENNKHKK